MFEVILSRKRQEADGIFSFRLENPDGAPLPVFEAGAHIDVRITEGLIRQYSLCNRPGAPDHYLIGVLDDPASRGGSQTLCRNIDEGQRLYISPPRNLFPLNADPATVPAPASILLLAGGIGITPILAMAEQLAAQERRFELHYCTRNRAKTAFFERIAQSPFSGHAQFHFDEGEQAQRFDVNAVLASAAKDAHLYLCGPAGFIEHVLGAARNLGWTEDRLHREYFAAPQAAAGPDAAFEIEIASTGEIVQVAAGESTVKALARHGVEIPMSCEQGVCGTCLTGVLAGVPEHRDSFLNMAERAANNQFLPCCSRARSQRLTLDL